MYHADEFVKESHCSNSFHFSCRLVKTQVIHLECSERRLFDLGEQCVFGHLCLIIQSVAGHY